MREYFRWYREGVPYPLVALEDDAAVLNVRYYYHEVPAVSLITNPTLMIYKDERLVRGSTAWIPCTREEACALVRKLGYKKCLRSI